MHCTFPVRQLDAWGGDPKLCLLDSFFTSPHRAIQLIKDRVCPVEETIFEQQRPTSWAMGRGQASSAHKEATSRLETASWAKLRAAKYLLRELY